MTDLEATAIAGLEAAFGSGTPAASGLAPGRTTLLGEHVDYVGGRVACMAIDLALAVAVRPSADARWRVVSGGERVEREGPGTARDIGDRVFAAASALGRFGVLLPPLDIGVASQLPRSSGLSSSAALTAASLVAMLRLARARLGADDLVAAALIAEREIVGVPCGDLDPLAVVHGRADAVLLLDCATGARETRAWPWPEIRLIVAGSGERHDVQGAGYRARREQAERACALLGATGCQEIGDRWQDLPTELRATGRHIATETRRTDAGIAALEAADPQRLGLLINQSHASLSRDLRVSTDRIDAMAAAARGVPGCYGARLVGGGFGGSALALVDRSAADACAAAMAAAAGPEAATWLIAPSDGVAALSPDVVTAPAAAPRSGGSDDPGRGPR